MIRNIAVTSMLTLALASAATAAPCQDHVGRDRKACMRAQMPWPPNPTPSEIHRRVDRIGGRGTWDKARRVAVCETGANPRHYIGTNGTPHGSYIGALGMYARTFAYGSKATGYRGRTYQEQVAIAVAAFPITGGWSGWGCSNA
jgi:hypothetical protein